MKLVQNATEKKSDLFVCIWEMLLCGFLLKTDYGELGDEKQVLFVFYVGFGFFFMF